MPFCLLDSIHSHQQAVGRSQRSRPGTAQGKRRPTAFADSEPMDRSPSPHFTPSPHSTRSIAPSTSATASASPFLSPSPSHRPTQRQSEQRQLQRELKLHDREERKEPEASPASVDVSPLRHSPPPLPLQRSIHLLRASPLLAHYLPLLSSIDTRWTSLISHQSPHHRTEAHAMARLRAEERQVRDGLLAFLRVAMEYRRVDVHDEDGRVVGEGEEEGEAEGGEGVGKGWLVLDDDQSGSLDVDWNGRYWRSERRREKEAWYRREERQLQGLHERGLQVLTELYGRRFAQLQDFAHSAQLSGQSQTLHPRSPSLGAPMPSTQPPSPPMCSPLADDAQCLQLQTKLHEVLTALQSSVDASSSSSPTVDGSSHAHPVSLLPPPHPSLSSHSLRLHSQLSELSSLLSSHYLRVLSIIEHAHSLTSSSSTLDTMITHMHQEDRDRREEIDQLREEMRVQREEAEKREEEWREKLRQQQLDTWKEREEVHRVQRQMAELHDSLQRIEANRKAEGERQPVMVDAEAQGDGGAGPLRREHWEWRAGNSEWRNAGEGEEGKPRLALQLGGSASSSPRPTSPSPRPLLSARSLSRAAALVAADRGGVSARGKPLAAPSKTQKQAERESDSEATKARKWDGVPFV